mmetsp:Transcript_21568/g.46623  ORF Transcript_21568/g.46623 Transcript_21568/m.46623 type:complete len:211 (-) Transcript_21568:2016-2648(-)
MPQRRRLSRRTGDRRQSWPKLYPKSPPSVCGSPCLRGTAICSLRRAPCYGGGGVLGRSRPRRWMMIATTTRQGMILLCPTFLILLILYLQLSKIKPFGATERETVASLMALMSPCRLMTEQPTTTTNPRMILMMKESQLSLILNRRGLVGRAMTIRGASALSLLCLIEALSYWRICSFFLLLVVMSAPIYYPRTLPSASPCLLRTCLRRR